MTRASVVTRRGLTTPTEVTAVGCQRYYLGALIFARRRSAIASAVPSSVAGQDKLGRPLFPECEDRFRTYTVSLIIGNSHQ